MSVAYDGVMMMMMMMTSMCDSPSEGACCTSDCQLISRHVAYVCRQETSCQTTSLCEYPLTITAFTPYYLHVKCKLSAL